MAQIEPTPIPSLYTMAADIPLVCIQGTLTAIYKRKQGTSARGEWSMQDAEIEQNGARIKLWLKDRPELTADWKGRNVVIEAYHGDRGWTGVYTFDDEYNGKTTRKVKLTSTANINEIANGSAQQPQQPQQPAQQPAPRQQAASAPAQQTQPQAQQHAPATPARKHSMQEAVESANQIANLQLLAFTTIANYVAPRFKLTTGKEMDEQAKSAASMNMIIEMMRKGYQANMPTFRLPITPSPTPNYDDPDPSELDADGNYRF